MASRVQHRPLRGRLGDRVRASSHRAEHRGERQGDRSDQWHWARCGGSLECSGGRHLLDQMPGPWAPAREPTFPCCWIVAPRRSAVWSCQTLGWHFYPVTRNGARLTRSFAKGSHTLTFRSSGEGAPQVEMVRLVPADQAQMAPTGLSDPETAYSAYIADLSSRRLPANYVKTSKDPGVWTSAVSYKYCAWPKMPFMYTYYAEFSLTAGQTVTFETRKDDPMSFDPVMYLFNKSNPALGSWWNDDQGGGNLQPKISVTIPTTGAYIVLLKGYDGSIGTADFYKDGASWASNVAIAGLELPGCYSGQTGTRNFFTANLTGDSRLWLFGDDQLVEAFNDDYQTTSPHDFSWGWASRIKGRTSEGRCLRPW